MFRASLKGRCGPILCLVAAALVALGAVAEEPKAAASPAANPVAATDASAEAARSAALAGLFKRYGVDLELDAQSGKLQSPSEQQLAALRAALAPLMKRPDVPPAPRRHANGMVQNQLGLWNFGASYAFIDPEHGLETQCIENLGAVPSISTTKRPVE